MYYGNESSQKTMRDHKSYSRISSCEINSSFKVFAECLHYGQADALVSTCYHSNPGGHIWEHNCISELCITRQAAKIAESRWQKEKWERKFKATQTFLTVNNTIIYTCLQFFFQN